MTIFVFLGPTLALKDARAILPDAIFLPPVGCGDVLAILKYQPSAIAIIDGYFGAKPSVWHKEILYALAHGVRVYGAASMGALRAAELDSQGMRGFGKVYAWYRSGDINDDDEVSVIHAPARLHYALGSTALVDFRQAFEEGVDRDLVSPVVAERALERLKNLHFSDRTWDGLPPEIWEDAPAATDRYLPFAQVKERLATASAKASDAKGLLGLLARGENLASDAAPETTQLLTAALAALAGRVVSRPLAYEGTWVRRTDIDGRNLRFAPQLYLLTSITARILALAQDAPLAKQGGSGDHVLAASLAIYVALQVRQCFGGDLFPQDDAAAALARDRAARASGDFIRAIATSEVAAANARSLKRMIVRLALLKASSDETVYDVLTRYGVAKEELPALVRMLVAIENFIMSFQGSQGAFPALAVDWWQQASDLVAPCEVLHRLSHAAERAGRARAMLETDAKSYYLVRFGFLDGRAELESCQ